jgi:predicted enzyme related to lactoylglutathione lyase
MKPQTMFEKVAFTMYPVEDMARAEKFYRETLGLGPSTGSVAHGWVEFDLPSGGCIALTTHSGSKPSSNGGGTLALEVADLDTLVAQLRTKNVKLPSTDIQSPVCRMAVCLDSDGNKIVLHELKKKKKPANKPRPPVRKKK